MVSNLRTNRRQTERAAATLSRLLLAPVAGEIQAADRLLIASSGALQYLPFGALPTPRGIERGEPLPLITRHQIIDLPSVSALAAMRAELGTRRAAPKAVAVLADPVFRPSDPRVQRPTAEPASPQVPEPGPVRAATATEDIVRFARAAGVNRLERLPFSRREAEAILSMAPPGETLGALDFAASQETVMGGELAHYRILHFATHGFLNSRQPELSGLVLSLVDEQGRPRDGYLALHEIYRLDLPAELVVLSACQTALGSQVRGEGLVGLARGFLHAGARAAVVSLWNVSDVATAELMERFYRRMLRQKERPASALRQAQLSMWREERWRAPYYWSGFIFQGDWR